MSFDPKTYLAQVGAKSLGFDPGKLDGLDGNNTRGAIAAFAASPLGLEAAGAVKPPTDAPTRQINAAGLELVQHFEGLFLTAYKDPVGIFTIGWGHTGLTHKDGTVYAGRKITREKAEALLARDLANFGKRVSEAVTVPLNDSQFAALVSFDFNTGGLFKLEPGTRKVLPSTLLRILNAGDYAGAADQLLRWDKAGGKTLAGLTRRRKSERNLFLGVHPAIMR